MRAEAVGPVTSLDLAQASTKNLGIVDEFSLEVVAMLERELLKDSFAEAMDREDRGLIELIENLLIETSNVVTELIGEQGLEKGVTQPNLQLTRSFFGVGNDQDFVDGGERVANQTEHETFERMGFSSASRRFDGRMPSEIESLHEASLARYVDRTTCPTYPVQGRL
jgi:hypothetical protein